MFAAEVNSILTVQNELNTDSNREGEIYSYLFMMFGENCGKFDDMNPWEMFLYILTHEGWLINQVGKFLYYEILSIKRNVPVWHI